MTREIVVQKMQLKMQAKYEAGLKAALSLLPFGDANYCYVLAELLLLEHPEWGDEQVFEAIQEDCGWLPVSFEQLTQEMEADNDYGLLSMLG